MNKKESSSIILALILITGVWFVATNGEKLKNLARQSASSLSGNKAMLSAAPSPLNTIATEPFPYFSNEIQVDSPKPYQIIKGTLFRLEGKIKTQDEAITVLINKKSSKPIKSESINLLNSGETGWKIFSSDFNVEPYNGMFDIEIRNSANTLNLAAFPIQIIQSL